MKKTIRLSFAIVFLFFSTVSFAQSPNPLYQHLPPTANHIYSVRLGQIITKGELGGVLQGIPMGNDPRGTWYKNILTSPAAAGVDIDHEILIAQTTASGEDADTLSYLQIFVPITDSAKFRSSLKEFKNQHLHRLPGKGATAYEKREGMAWNDKLLVITEASSTIPPSISDSTAVSMPGKNPHAGAAPAHKPAVTMRRPTGELAVEKSLAALAGFPDNPLLTDQHFITGFSTDEDVHAWTTKMDFKSLIAKLVKKMAAKNPAMQGKSFPQYGETAQTPHPPVLTTFNFENGRIVFRATTFSKPEDADIIHRIYDRPINTDLLARVPGGLLLGCATLHFNAAAVPDLLDKYGTRPMIDSMLGKKGLSIGDITPIFGGDLMVAALADTTATTDTTKKKINFYFVATLGDPSKMMQLAGKLASGNSPIDDTSAMAKMKKLADKIVVRDNLLVISGSKEMAKKYLDNQDRRSTSLLDDDKSSYAMAVDLKAVSKFVAATMTGNPKALLIARVIEHLDKVELTSKMNGNNTVMTFQIVTGDTSTNSLKTLISLAGYLH